MIIRRILLALGTAALTILALADSSYFTAWYAVYWGLITAATVLAIEWDSDGWGPHLRLAKPYQLITALALIAGALVATTWNSLGQRDAIQWTWTLCTIGQYWDGLKWGTKRIVHHTPLN